MSMIDRYWRLARMLMIYDHYNDNQQNRILYTSCSKEYQLELAVKVGGVKILIGNNLIILLLLGVTFDSLPFSLTERRSMLRVKEHNALMFNQATLGSYAANNY